MDKLLKNWKTLFIMLSLVSICFHVQAMKDIDEDIPMEGELGTTGMRSVVPQKSAHAVLSGDIVKIEFLQKVSLVTISLKTSDNTIVSTKTVSYPQYETISLEGLETGCYTLELSTDSGHMYGTFMYVY